MTQGAVRQSHVVAVRLAGAMTAMLFVAMAIHAAPLEPSIPEIQLTYSERSFRAILEQWQDDGIQRFRIHFAFDFPLLLSYGLFGYLYARSLSLRTARRALAEGILRWMLPGAALLDAAENLLHVHFIQSTAVPGGLYTVAGLVATSKWLLIAAFLLWVIDARFGNRGDL